MPPRSVASYIATIILAIYSSVAAATLPYVPDTPLKPSVEVENVISFSDEVQASIKDSQNYKKIFPETSYDLKYPGQSKRAHECGLVEFFLDIAQDGSVKSVKIFRSPFERLSKAVEDDALKWRFRPFKPSIGQNLIVGKFKATFRLDDENGAEIQCNP